MTICIPIDEDHGLESAVSQHFGSALRYLIVDTRTGACRSIANEHRRGGRGMCQPLAAVRREPIDGVVVGDIGRRALQRLEDDGIRVFRAVPATVKETVAALEAGRLDAVTPADACAGHGHGHGHDHTHGHGTHTSSHGEGRGAGRCQN